MLGTAAEISREVPFLEFRLDTLAHPGRMVEPLKTFLAANPVVTAIGTCRRKAAGGEFRGSAREEVEMLHEAAHAGCRIVDISLETAEEIGIDILQEIREAGASILLSWHDFSETPEMEPVLRRMRPFQPDFYKIVPTARSLDDSLKLIDLLERNSGDGDLVAMSMGLHGVLTRVLGPRFGSVFTFGSATPGQETAPGQVAARTLLELYRVNSIEAGRTKAYGVAGSPISGSRSPLMQNTAFRRETVDAVYLPLETSDAQELKRVMDRIPLSGVSVTMPLKEQVLPLLAKMDPLSSRIGAANTLVRAQDGRIFGFNTDVGGITGPLMKRMPLRGAKVLVLGAGGAARAAVFGLKDAGAEVFILNRTLEKAAALAKQAGAKVAKQGTLAKLHFSAIVNATPYGMAGQNIPCPITADEMNCDVFFDLVYNPMETPLVQMARAKGIAVIPGVEMFASQGARQFEIWTGKAAPETEMLRVVVHALQSAATAPEPTQAASEPAVFSLGGQDPGASPNSLVAKQSTAAKQASPRSRSTRGKASASDR